MREILFRGKKANTKEWVEGGIIPLDVDSGYVFISEPFLSASTLPVYEIVKNHTHLVLPESVGQFTGVTDRKGTKIFEGDILIFDDMGVYPVWWDRDYYAFGSCWFSDFDPLHKYDQSKIEVIGNIHDNPELLVQEEE